jgi:hypothetical protein
MTSQILPESRKKPKQERAVQAVAVIEQACGIDSAANPLAGFEVRDSGSERRAP